MRYAQILYSLAEGVHPTTGEAMPDVLRNDPEIIRALFCGARALEKDESMPKRKNLPANAGKSWKQEEDEFLKQAYAGGMSTEAIAQKMGRSRIAIEMRVEKYIDIARAPDTETKKKALNDAWERIRSNEGK
jgi:hypothetical protein